MGYKARLIARAFCLEACRHQACECGGIGIHSRLKICRREPCGFESRHSHHTSRKGALAAPFCCPAEIRHATAKVELVCIHWNATMRYSLFAGQRDVIILIARVLLMILFVISGWAKLTGFDGTVGYMTCLLYTSPRKPCAGGCPAARYATHAARGRDGCHAP